MSSVCGIDIREMEQKWQNYWDVNQVFKAIRRPNKKKKYVLDMFPYPSAAGLHVGHPAGYTATDIMARYWRMNDYDVLHPMGWDAFGLPAEQHAIATSTHPSTSTQRNISNFKRQLKSIGFSYDWSHEINTTDPGYYKWTQWIFLKLFESGLAYQDKSSVNWCPKLGTVLANEEVINGLSERGQFPVISTPIRQWSLRITDYASRLSDDLDLLVDWPDGTLRAQSSWIGREAGFEMIMRATADDDDDVDMKVFMTKAGRDEMRHAVCVLISPDYHLAKFKHAIDMKDGCDVKRTKYQVRNPIDDSMLIVMVDKHASLVTHARLVVESEVGNNNDLSHATANLIGNRPYQPNPLQLPQVKPCVMFKLRDWVFSRQRYWGEPIPIYFPVEFVTGNSDADPRYCDESLFRIRYDIPIAVSKDELPILLPDITRIEPGDEPEGCLSRAKEWRFFQRDGKWYARETNTMPQWAGSCWYYLRFTDPFNSSQAWSQEAIRDWMPVDLYVGGQEHAVLHLLYARFWHKVLFDAKLVDDKEPFVKLVHQGMILGPDGEKMSKSRGNVVSPDDVICSYGADVLRLYEMFMGPIDAAKPWQTSQVMGCVRFRDRVINLVVNSAITHKTETDDDDDGGLTPTFKLMNETIVKVTRDIDNMHFNTAISSLMVFSSHLASLKHVPKLALVNLCLLLSPFAPHTSEECLSIVISGVMNGEVSVKDCACVAAWPTIVKLMQADADENDVKVIGIYVNGKLRGKMDAKGSYSQEFVLEQVKKDAAKWLESKTIRRVIYEPGKMINIVVD